MSATDSTIKNVKQSAGFLTVLGILLVLFGFLAIGAPLVTGVAVEMTVGVLLLISGVCQVFYAFRAQSWGAGILTFAIGAASVVAGGLMLARPLVGLAAMTLVLAVYFFVNGLSEIIHAFDVKPMPGWGFMLFTGVITMLLGIMIWRQWPLSGAWAIGVLVGVKILFSGTTMLAFGGAARGAARQAEAGSA